jgi:hypothetical protein
MSAGAADGPAARADRLLRDVLGAEQYERLRGAGYLDLPSRRRRGRVYRLDSLGNLSYRDPGETGFSTTLCVQPEEAVPRDDQVAMRYLLVTADEDRLLRVANPNAFRFVPLARALHHDFRQRYSVLVSALLTLAVIAFFLLSTVAAGWALSRIFAGQGLFAVLLFLLFLIPGFLGLVLLAAGVVELHRTWVTWRARRRLSRA